LFAGGRLAAILDWESTHVGPRLFELLRAMDLMLDLDPAACRLFLAAFDAAWPLDRADLELAAAQWGWFRAHNLWFYETLYREGNERVRRFLRPGGFVPFEVRWQAVMKELPCLNM
jgi:aminoglycoside phosphotransferase (APT) family kinase protein